MNGLDDLKNSLLNLGLVKQKNNKKNENNGYVYLLKSDREWYKIGISINYKKRCQGIIGGLPFKAEIYYHKFVSNYKKCETELHYRFAKKRQGGEWFILNEKDVQYIKAYLDKREAKN
jgi:hypothetical protein